jgi:hypothetical protein
MSDNLNPPKEFPTPTPDDRIGQDIRKCIDAEIMEMEKYKWCMGVHLQHDPLQDRSLNEIYCEWINKYAADFRKDWDKKKPQQPPQ